MFSPWVGAHWGAAENLLHGKKLLVLGQSHYTSNEAAVGTSEPDGTKVIVQEWALEKSARFFTNITQTIANKPKWKLSQGELQDVWDSIAFYNYVPVYAATGPRQLPKGEMFQLGKGPFERVLEQIRPQAVLVLGNDVWWWLIKSFNEVLLNQASELRNIEVRGLPFARIRHPSAAFSFAKERPHLDDLLRRIDDNAEKLAGANKV